MNTNQQVSMKSLAGLLSFSCGVVIAASCNAETKLPNRFVLRPETQSLWPEAKQAVTKVLNDKFGSPAKPAFWKALPVEFGEADDVLPFPLGWKLKAGRDLFMNKCAACHGASGDGNGLNAAKHFPRPRDFRLGVFKWTSTMGRKPLRHDLRETLRIGIPGTAMPAFSDLREDQAKHLVEYVRWLSMRGEFERELVRAITAECAEDEEIGERELSAIVAEIGGELTHGWLGAEQESEIVRTSKKLTPPTAESIARGRELYLSAKANCSKCHGRDGRGAADFRKQDIGEQFAAKDDWGQPSIAWDLNEGVFRGGDGPDDLYRRIRGGILGSPMPTYQKRFLSDDNVWDLVNYMLSLRPERVRGKKVAARRSPPLGPSEDRYEDFHERLSEDEYKYIVDKFLEEVVPKWTGEHSGWGALRGRFAVDGRVPEPRRVPIFRDKHVFGDSMKDPTLQVGENGGLANMVVVLRIRGVPVHESYKESSDDKVVLSTVSSHRIPYVVGLRIGQTLEIRNRDPVGHNYRYSPREGDTPFNMTLPANGNLLHKARASSRLPTRVTCTVHPWERSWVFVRDNPYFAVTDNQGQFEIKNLPAGELEFELWHERLDRREIDVGGWKNGRQTFVLSPEEVKDLIVRIPAKMLR